LQGLPWINRLHRGLLTLDYVSTTLAHEASYKLDLTETKDRALAMTVLERAYQSQVKTAEGATESLDGCDIMDAKLNGMPVDFKHWRIGKQVGSAWIVSDDIHSSNARNHWRLPLTGDQLFSVLTGCALDNQPFHGLVLVCYHTQVCLSSKWPLTIPCICSQSTMCSFCQSMTQTSVCFLVQPRLCRSLC
jgi:hypothetical protein